MTTIGMDPNVPCARHVAGTGLKGTWHEPLGLCWACCEETRGQGVPGPHSLLISDISNTSDIHPISRSCNPLSPPRRL